MKNGFRRCIKCGLTKPLDGFIRRQFKCKACQVIYKKDMQKQEKYTQNKSCPQYLGIHIAEKILSRYFDNVQRMPINNRGFDFTCSRGYKIDVKSACLQSDSRGRSNAWKFTISQNQIADYFLCLAFDNRDEFNPLHIWLIPGIKVRHLKTLNISDLERSLSKWSEYEKALERVIICCDAMKAGAL